MDGKKPECAEPNHPDCPVLVLVVSDEDGRLVVCASGAECHELRKVATAAVFGIKTLMDLAVKLSESGYTPYRLPEVDAAPPKGN